MRQIVVSAVMHINRANHLQLTHHRQTSRRIQSWWHLSQDFASADLSGPAIVEYPKSRTRLASSINCRKVALFGERILAVASPATRCKHSAILRCVTQEATMERKKRGFGEAVSALRSWMQNLLIGIYGNGSLRLSFYELCCKLQRTLNAFSACLTTIVSFSCVTSS